MKNNTKVTFDMDNGFQLEEIPEASTITLSITRNNSNYSPNRSDDIITTKPKKKKWKKLIVKLAPNFACRREKKFFLDEASDVSSIYSDSSFDPAFNKSQGYVLGSSPSRNSPTLSPPRILQNAQVCYSLFKSEHDSFRSRIEEKERARMESVRKYYQTYNNGDSTEDINKSSRIMNDDNGTFERKVCSFDESRRKENSDNNSE